MSLNVNAQDDSVEVAHIRHWVLLDIWGMDERGRVCGVVQYLATAIRESMVLSTW